MQTILTTSTRLTDTDVLQERKAPTRRFVTGILRDKKRKENERLKQERDAKKAQEEANRIAHAHMQGIEGLSRKDAKSKASFTPESHIVIG